MENFAEDNIDIVFKKYFILAASRIKFRETIPLTHNLWL